MEQFPEYQFTTCDKCLYATSCRIRIFAYNPFLIHVHSFPQLVLQLWPIIMCCVFTETAWRSSFFFPAATVKCCCTVNASCCWHSLCCCTVNGCCHSSFVLLLFPLKVYISLGLSSLSTQSLLNTH